MKKIVTALAAVLALSGCSLFGARVPYLPTEVATIDTKEPPDTIPADVPTDAPKPDLIEVTAPVVDGEQTFIADGPAPQAPGPEVVDDYATPVGEKVLPAPQAPCDVAACQP